MARPKPLDPGILERICEELIAGRSMRDICRSSDMPVQSAVYVAMAAHEGFRSSITRARAEQQEAIADHLVDMADDATPEDWNVVKLRIWARTWRASKLAPRKYGDKVTQEHVGADGGPIQTKEMSDNELVRRLALILSGKAD